MNLAQRLMPGSGTTAAESLLGQIVSARANRRAWRHPWQTNAAWSASTERWCAVVKAGYVNGIAPIFRVERDTTPAPQAERDFGINPLSGEPYFSSYVFQKPAAPVVHTSEVIDVPLYLAPAVPLQEWRAVGEDGSGNEELPLFFASRGVADFAPAETPDPQTVRRLRAIDVILHQPRLALTSTTEAQPGVLDGVSNFRQILGTRAPNTSDTLRVYAGTLQPPATPDPLLDDFEEEPWDERKIATVYLLSPPGAAAGAAVNAAWQPYVRHSLFWNLHWVPAPPLRAVDVAGTTPFYPVSPIAQPIINFFTAALNDAAQEALNTITARSQAGTWYTPTGGGSESVFPALSLKIPAVGFDKGARLLAQAQADQAARTIAAQASLDPAFPWSAAAFDPSRLNAFA